MSFIINKIKPFDYNDKYNYLSDNQTIGTSQYYKKKYGEKFSDLDYRILEIKSRDEYTLDDLEEAILYRKQQKMLIAYEYNNLVKEPMDNWYKLMHEIKMHYNSLTMHRIRKQIINPVSI